MNLIDVLQWVCIFLVLAVVFKQIKFNENVMAALEAVEQFMDIFVPEQTTKEQETDFEGETLTYDQARAAVEEDEKLSREYWDGEFDKGDV